MIGEFFPFMVLLTSLFVVSGGIVIRGDLPAHPSTNVAILAIGALLASFIGTTGASMLLIRFLLKVNSERRRQAHTIVFFIFLVSNIGGSLLPMGDPPLYLGYLKGVPFWWTLSLWKGWLLLCGALLAIYWVWDTIEYRREGVIDLVRDERTIEPVGISGLRNLPLLLMLIASIALLDPTRAVVGTEWHPPIFFREGMLIGISILSLLVTPRTLREENEFHWSPIVEVAALFFGIFIAMQVPLAVLHAKGPSLGLDSPVQFFWATGILSGVLDNAPTYLAFLATAQAQGSDGSTMIPLHNGSVREDFLRAISLGAVFMGANTYIGNGPNFMVKAIAERSGVRMPSFFGYMALSGAVLIPLLVIVSYFVV